MSKKQIKKRKTKPDLGFAGVPASFAEFAWRHEAAKELAGEAAKWMTPAWAEYELLRANYGDEALAAGFSPICRGAVVGETVPGCTHVTISIAPGATRYQVAKVVAGWLTTLPTKGPPTAHRNGRNYIAMLRDLAALRAKRAGLTRIEAEDAITEALESLVTSPRDLNALVGEIAGHYSNNSETEGRVVARAKKHLEAERERVVTDLATEQNEQALERRAQEESGLRTDLVAAEAADDRKTAKRIRRILG